MAKRAIVIGGGFSGLTTAYYLCRAGFSVEVHEKSSSWGGVLRTHHTPFGMIETAANGIFKTQTFVDLCQDLGVSLLESGEKSKKRFIYRGRPQRWPLGKWETIKQLIPFLFLLLNKNSKKPAPGQPLSEWVKKNLGPAVLDYLVAPALQGVYADDPSHMSASLVMRNFFHPEAKRGGKASTVAPAQGMEELIGGLVHWLKENHAFLHLDSHYNLPEKLPCPHVLCTNLKDIPHESFAQKLSSVEKLSLISTTVFFRRSSKDLGGFGCLFPKPEKFFHLGVLYNDCIFRNRSEGYRSETWIGGGRLNPTAINLSDKEILERILNDRRRIQENSEIQFSQVTRWPEVLPNYGRELEEALEELDLPPQLYLNGNYMGGIGLSHILERASGLAHSIDLNRA